MPKRKPIPEKELKILLNYLEGRMDYQNVAKVIGTDNHSVFQWLGSRCIRAVLAKQIPLSQESK